MYELGKLFIPLSINYDERNDSITIKQTTLSQQEYFENVEYTLDMSFDGPSVCINYYGENDTNLDEVLEIEGGLIARGELEAESFEDIQKRVFDVLKMFMIDPETEMEDYFNGL